MPAAKRASVFFRADTREKIVALTFDDGPLGRTPALLEILRRRHAAATFFLLAPRLTAAKARLYDDPLFTVGLHGYHHLDYRKLPSRRIRRELDRALELFDRFGLRPRYFRPPYGMVSARLPGELARRHLRTVLWSLDSQDWNRYRGKRLLHNVTAHLTPGSVILLHDQSASPKEIGALVDAIRHAGYRIVPLATLIEKGSKQPCKK